MYLSSLFISAECCVWVVYILGKAKQITVPIACGHFLLTQQVWVKLFPENCSTSEGASNQILGGQDYFLNFHLPFLPATPSSWSRKLEGFFELTQFPSRAPSPHALLLGLQRNKDTVRCDILSAKVSGHYQLCQNLIVCLLETDFFLLFK